MGVPMQLAKRDMHGTCPATCPVDVPLMGFGMAPEDKPLWMLSRKEMRARRRREWRETQAAKTYIRSPGTFGPASDCKRIDPATGNVIGIIPRRPDDAKDQ